MKKLTLIITLFLQITAMADPYSSAAVPKIDPETTIYPAKKEYIPNNSLVVNPTNDILRPLPMRYPLSQDSVFARRPSSKEVAPVFSK